MVYYFEFGNHIFAIHSDFEIPWYEWHTHFLETSYDKNSFPVTHYLSNATIQSRMYHS